MPRETIAGKAERILLERRVAIAEVRTGDHLRRYGRVHVLARVRGDTASHVVRHDPRTGWACTCPATTRCSHLIAVQLVVDTNPPMPTAPARSARWVPATEPQEA